MREFFRSVFAQLASFADSNLAAGLRIPSSVQRGRVGVQAHQDATNLEYTRKPLRTRQRDLEYNEGLKVPAHQPEDRGPACLP